MRIYGQIAVGDLCEMTLDGASRLALVVEESYWGCFEVMVNGTRRQVHKNLLRDISSHDIIGTQDEKLKIPDMI